MDQYTEAHVFTAAIRVLRHRKQAPPAIGEICELLNVSAEAGLATGRKLEKLNIVTISEDPFSITLDISDHLAIENLPKEEAQDLFSRDLESFMAKKKDMDRKVEAIKADIEKKKQGLKSDFEARLKQEMDKMQKNG